MALPVEVKAVQDAIALTTAARTFDPTDDLAMLAMVVGRSPEAIANAAMVLARLLSSAVPEDVMERMARKYAAMDRHATVAV